MNRAAERVRIMRLKRKGMSALFMSPYLKEDAAKLSLNL
jgi:hypothetical protein